MMLKKILPLILLFAPGAALAADNIALSSEVFVERTVAKPDGRTSTVLETPSTVVPGDQLVFVVKYKNVGTSTANDFTVTNPLPQAVAFKGTADGKEVVSVDGGKQWGTLSSLSVIDADGEKRPAQLTDVTHVKWNFNQSLSVGSEGKLIFRGAVK